MRHAGLAARPVGPLPIAVIEAPFGALLVPAASRAETPGPAFPPTREATVGMAPITRGTEEEGLPAPPAGPHPEDLHGPAGPEMSGGQWTSVRECATTRSSRPRPRGVGAPEGPEVQLWALTLPPPGSRQPTRKLIRLPLSVRQSVPIYPFSEER